MPTDKRIIEFKTIVLSYYKKHKRDLPWRKTDNPYHIVVSEIMLQQTQVSRVTIKYAEFIQTFPNWESLAKATFAEVLEKWSGLGYNRRAKYLQQIAQKVIYEFNGVLPDGASVLETFPGIGKATAASITVYSFNKPIPFIETNVRRVFIHHFFKDRENISDKELEPFVERTIDKTNPKEWYWALMDYGTYMATQIENPNRKSKHYAKQSKFEGSVRKVRGEILRQLLKHQTMNEEQLYQLSADKEKVDEAIYGLLKDHLIMSKGRTFSLVLH
jgi:A/G-specific adenine glycosylase